MATPGGSSPGRAALAGAAIVTIAVYLGFILAWRDDKPEVVTPEDSAIATAVQADLHALQARGFLKGQLHLDLEPPPELVAAANPYDPAQRPPVLYLHDSSLFRGRYYMYFGPAPAVLLFAPWKVLTGHDLPTPYAVGVFASLAYLGLLALFRGIVRTHYPEASRTAQWAGIVGLGGASLLIPLVRRPAVYEVSIACGCALATWGLYCAWRSRASPRPLAWAAGCGLLFGFAVAARPTFGLGAIAALLLMLPAQIPEGLRSFLRRGLMAAAAGAALVAALLAYNYARFDDPLQFGQKYQLSAQEEGAIQHFSLRFAPTQAWFYLLAPLRPTPYFPFFDEVAEPTLPDGFGEHEFSFGVWTNLPILWFALAALIAIARGGASRPILVPLAVGAVIALAPLLFFFGSCVRYQAEFGPILMLLASLGVLEAEGFAASRARLRRAVAGIACVLAVASTVVVLLASVDMYNASAHVAPRGLEAIGRWLNRPILAWRGEDFGPLHLKLQPGDTMGRRETLLEVQGPAGAREIVEIERIDPASVRIVARREGPEPFERTAIVPAPAGATHDLVASMSSLYPLRAIELPSEPDRDHFRALKLWLRIAWDGQSAIEEALPIAPWRATRVAVGPRDDATAFSGRVLAQRREEIPIEQAGEAHGGVRVRIAVTPELHGRALPLGVTGRHGRGNFLFVRISDAGELHFGYDHWGKPVILASKAMPAMDGERVVEFWMPSMLSASAASPLVVKVDGVTVWRASVPFYPARNEEMFIVRNPLGGSACEREFPGARIEATRLAAP